MEADIFGPQRIPYAPESADVAIWRVFALGVFVGAGGGEFEGLSLDPSWQEGTDDGRRVILQKFSLVKVKNWLRLGYATTHKEKSRN